MKLHILNTMYSDTAPLLEGAHAYNHRLTHTHTIEPSSPINDDIITSRSPPHLTPAPERTNLQAFFLLKYISILMHLKLHKQMKKYVSKPKQ